MVLGEKIPTNSHNSMKQDMGCTHPERDETNVFKVRSVNFTYLPSKPSLFALLINPLYKMSVE